VTILREDYERYLALTKEAGELKEKMFSHIKQVAGALLRINVSEAYLQEKVVWVSQGGTVGSGEDSTISTDLLFAPDWRERIALIHQQQEERMKEWQRKMAERRNRETEEKERRELQRLLVKYPQEQKVRTGEQ